MNHLRYINMHLSPPSLLNPFIGGSFFEVPFPQFVSRALHFEAFFSPSDGNQLTTQLQ